MAPPVAPNTAVDVKELLMYFCNIWFSVNNDSCSFFAESTLEITAILKIVLDIEYKRPFYTYTSKLLLQLKHITIKSPMVSHPIFQLHIALDLLYKSFSCFSIFCNVVVVCHWWCMKERERERKNTSPTMAILPLELFSASHK